MKKATIALVIVGTILFIIGLPLFIDWAIIGNSFPSNISNTEWVGFFGGYIGSLIGGLSSLIGIALTIRFTREQNRKDREAQVRPYCITRMEHENISLGTHKILDEIAFGFKPESNDGPRDVTVLYLKNIGVGPAVNFHIDVDIKKAERQYYGVLLESNYKTLQRRTDVLQIGEEAAIPISVFFNFDPIDPSKIEIETDFNGKEFTIVNYETLVKYKNFDLVLDVKYSDIYKNEYQQRIVLQYSFSVNTNEEKMEAYHIGNVILAEKNPPVIEL